MSEGISHGGGHEGRGAGGGNDCGEDTSHEGGGGAVALDEFAAEICEGGAEFERAVEVEPNGEEKVGEEADDEGALQLEAPADLCACGF